MPTVPTYDTFQAAPATLPQPTVRAYDTGIDPGKPMQQFGKAMTAGGDALAKIASEQSRLDNQATIDKAEASLRDWMVERDRALVDARGENAAGITQKFATDFKDYAGKLTEGMNDATRAEWSKRSATLGMGAVERLSHHEATEKQRARMANNEALGKTLLDAAVRAPVQDFERARIDLFSNIEQRAGLMGLGVDSDAVKRMKGEALGNVQYQRVVDMMNRNPTGALAYFKDHDHEIIDPRQRQQLEHAVTRASSEHRVEVEVEKQFGELMKKGDPGVILTWATAQFTGDEQKHALGIAREMLHAREIDIRATLKADADQGWQTIFQTGSLRALPKDLKQRIQAGDHQTWQAMEAYVKSKQAGTGEAKRKTDPGLYYELMQTSVKDPAGFAALDLRQHIGKLDEGDFEYFAKQQANAARPEAVRDAATLQQQLGVAHNLMKLGSRDQDKKGAFDKAVITAVEAEQQRAGRPLPLTDRQKIIDRMMIDGAVESGHWYLPDSGRKFYEVAGTTDAEKWKPAKPVKAERLADVPAADQRQIRDAARKAGVTATPQMIIRKYNGLHGL